MRPEVTGQGGYEQKAQVVAPRGQTPEGFADSG
jgi:hypothetical protein